MRPKKTIILADDVESSLCITKVLLEVRGHYSVLPARNVHALFNLLDAIQADVVLLAFSGPDIKRGELVEEVERKYAEVRVLAITPDASPAVVLDAVKLWTQRKRGPKKRTNGLAFAAGAQQ